MELIYLGFILFIVGVGSTIVYDKYKEKQANRPAPTPKAVRKPRVTKSIYEEESDAFEDFMKKTRAKKAVSPAAQQIDTLIAQVKARAAAGEKRITMTQGVQTETLTVNQLIKKLEDMKKKL